MACFLPHMHHHLLVGPLVSRLYKKMGTLTIPIDFEDFSPKKKIDFEDATFLG